MSSQVRCEMTGQRAIRHKTATAQYSHEIIYNDVLNSTTRHFIVMVSRLLCLFAVVSILGSACLLGLREATFTFPSSIQMIRISQWPAILKTQDFLPLCSPRNTSLNFRNGFPNSPPPVVDDIFIWRYRQIPVYFLLREGQWQMHSRCAYGFGSVSCLRWRLAVVKKGNSKIYCQTVR